MLRLREWNDVLNDDFPQSGKVTPETVSRSVQMAYRGARSSMRVATGRIYTTAQYESYRRRILETPLP